MSLTVPICGCGRPTWNRRWNELCDDLTCQGPPRPEPRCGCGAPTWNGQWGELCRRSCSGPRLARCGCGAPTWNGQWGELCRRSCSGPRLADPVPAPTAPPGAARCGCGAPTWNGQWNELCRKSCHGPRIPDPATASRGAAPKRPKLAPAPPPAPAATCGCGNPTWNGQWGELCRRLCPGPRRQDTADTSTSAKFIKKLDPANEKYKELEKHYLDTWDKEGRAKFKRPTIKDIWDITDDVLRAKFLKRCKGIGNVAVYGKGTSPGNVQRRFHGTTLKCSFAGSPCSTSGCSACGIINHGFLMQYAVTGKGRLFFGRGLYSTSASSSALRYAKDKTKITGGLFVVQVACGKAETLNGSDLTDNRLEDQDGPPHGFDSRIVNKPHDTHSYKQHSATYGEPLLYSDDELIVFDDDAMLPRYLMTFQ